MATDDDKHKRLRQIEGGYAALEASIADIDRRLMENPRDQKRKADRRNQRTKLSKLMFEAETLRIELGLPIEEEDPNRAT